jgi:hypothetical protein
LICQLTPIHGIFPSSSLPGKVQEMYYHGVPEDRTLIAPPDSGQSMDTEIDNINDDPYNLYRRLVIVFRCGEMKYYEKDSGAPIKQHKPRLLIHNDENYTFGLLSNLEEGTVYRRQELYDMGAHM